jgi:hypothetical protein
MSALPIIYNSQRNNFDFAGQFRGSCQCFSTSVWMAMSYFNSAIIADDDIGLSRYVDDVSDVVGSAGIAEEIKKEVSGIVGNSAYFWQVQQAGMKKWMDGTTGEAIWEKNATYDRISELCEETPIVLGTSKLAGLPGGHIILAIGNAGNGLFFHDPYGDAVSWYKNPNGGEVIYPREFIEPAISGNILYWKV